MPYYHCRKCHHEFEYIPIKAEKPYCDWCGTDKPTILEDRTPLEKMADNWGKVMETVSKIDKK